MSDLLVDQARALSTAVEIVDLPGDKSISHRALLMALLTPGSSRLVGLNQGSAVTVLIDALSRLGCQLDGTLERLDVASVTDGQGLALKQQQQLDLGSSSTAARLLLGVLAGLGVQAVISGNASLCARPMDWVVEPLRALGAEIHYLDQPGRLPLRLLGGRLHAGEVHLSVASAQARSAMLFAAIAARVPLSIEQAPGSRDHTERMLGSLGVEVAVRRHQIEVAAATPRAMPEYRIPRDPSAAAYPIAAHVLLRQAVQLKVPDLCLNPTRTGIFRLLQRMGAPLTLTVNRKEHGEDVGSVAVTGAAQTLRPFSLSGRATIHSMIDELPLAAALASQADGRSTIADAEELLFKETNRIATSQRTLAGFGVDIRADGGSLQLRGPSAPTAAEVPSFGDHRIAMTAATLASLAPGRSRVLDGGSAALSFPCFAEVMGQVGCMITSASRKAAQG